MKLAIPNFKNGFMNVLSPLGGYIYKVESLEKYDSEKAKNFTKMVDGFRSDNPDAPEIEKIWHKIVLTITKYGDNLQWMLTSSIKLYEDMDWVSYSNRGDLENIDFAFAIFDNSINMEPENGKDIYILSKQAADDVSEEEFGEKENLEYQAVLKKWLANDVKF